MEPKVVPIWVKEQEAEAERHRQSMLIRNTVEQTLETAKRTERIQNCHPGQFKTCYRENFDSSGTVLLVPEGLIWTCCRSTDENASGCVSAPLSSVHTKCGKCGDFFLEVQNHSKNCFFHSGNVLKPPSTGDEELPLFHQCCMKPVGSRGCNNNKHIPLHNWKPNPKHEAGPLASPRQSATATPNRARTATPKFDPSKVKTRDASSPSPAPTQNKTDNNANGKPLPIWERERLETEERKRQSVMVHTAKAEVVKQTTTLSPYHNKCKKCGIFFLEVESKQDSCCYHQGNIIKPPQMNGDDDSNLLFYQCCMKPLGSKGCSSGRHVILENYKPLGDTSRATTATAGATTAQKEAIVEATKTVLMGMKQVGTMVNDSEEISKVVAECKKVVGNCHVINSHIEKFENVHLSECYENFRDAVLSFLRAVQMACKQHYAPAYLSTVEQECRQVVSVARTLLQSTNSVAAARIAPSSPSPPRPPVAPPASFAPPPPPPSFTSSPSAGTKPKGKNDKGMLLASITAFSAAKLKKAVTVDKSKPVITAELEEGQE